MIELINFRFIDDFVVVGAVPGRTQAPNIKVFAFDEKVWFA